LEPGEKPFGKGEARGIEPAKSEQVIDSLIEPGALVRHPEQSDWGLGQVQSVVGAKVTVNFEHAGKKTIDAAVVPLVYVGPDPRERR
jgi:Protein of unknown function (DUF3553)